MHTHFCAGIGKTVWVLQNVDPYFDWDNHKDVTVEKRFMNQWHNLKLIVNPVVMTKLESFIKMETGVAFINVCQCHCYCYNGTHFLTEQQKNIKKEREKKLLDLDTKCK